MPLRRVAITDIKPFDYRFEAGIGGRMTDVGRTLGSDRVGLIIQTVKPGDRSSRRHRHLFQEEILIVMAGTATLLHGDERVPARAGDAFCYRAGDPEPHTFENTGADDLVIWAFGNRFAHEVCVYPDQGVAFVEGLGAEVPLDGLRASDWTEDRRKT
ncbi:cupin domain-containing protein [Phreatobacter sp. HK31-P]